jgi:hypothetical protein
MVRGYAHPAQEHQMRAMEHLEQYNAARQMEVMPVVQGSIAGMVQ